LRGLILNPKEGKLYFAKKITQLTLGCIDGMENSTVVCRLKTGESIGAATTSLINPTLVAWDQTYTQLDDDAFFTIKMFEIKSTMVALRESFRTAHKDGPAQLTNKILGVLETHIIGERQEPNNAKHTPKPE